MHSRGWIAGFLFTLTLFPLAASARPNQVELLAGSCTSRPITACDVDLEGTLEAGDCTLGDGTKYDRFTFQGTAGQVIEVVVRPLDASYTKPWMWLLSPLGDSAEPPEFTGGPAGTITYELSSSGLWTILVGTEDLFAGGRYVLHVYCYDQEPDLPQECVFQHLLCGQEFEWRLTGESCRYTQVPRAYSGYWIYGKQGDNLHLEMEAFGFTPIFTLYSDDDRVLRTSNAKSSFQSEMFYFVQQTGWYYVLATSTEDNKGGFYSLRMSCNSSGCLFPYLTTGQPPDLTVKKGTTGVLPLNVHHLGGYTAKLYEDFDAVVTAGPNAPSIATPPANYQRTYTLWLENACGAWVSDAFTVSPVGGRRRAVRH